MASRNIFSKSQSKMCVVQDRPCPKSVGVCSSCHAGEKEDCNFIGLRLISPVKGKKKDKKKYTSDIDFLRYVRI